ncbi:MAG: bacteriohemerythrin [Anaeromyxobacter sp.]|nr:bacteriohemerythrin [Anaeromyxobacter sp.]MBL0274555.1 bacteriohemerythrin [Anaeromyxobacter sp.]
MPTTHLPRDPVAAGAHLLAETPGDAAATRDQLLSALQAERAAHARTREAMARSEAAAGRFVPRQLLALLGAERLGDLALGDAVERKLTILFSDIRGFTALCEGMSPRDTFRFLNSFLGVMEPVVTRHHGFVDKYIGDAVMALFPGGADDAVAAGVGMLEALEDFNASRGREGRPRIGMGVGLNHGMVTLGTVGGAGRIEGTVVSDAVNLASRLEGLTKRYGAPLLVSEAALYALDGAAERTVRFLDRIRVKGKRQPQSVYEVFEADPPARRAAKLATLPWFEEAVACYHLREVGVAEPLLRRCLEAAPDDAAAALYLARCREYLASGKHEGTGELDGTLPWRDEFTLGLDPVDGQHHELLDAMNRLTPLLHAGDGSGAEATLAFLASYVRDHFGTEEALMGQHGYPFTAEHVREHQNFIAFLRRLAGQVTAGRPRLHLVFQIQIFLLDWFANHSTGTDRHLARWLRAQEADPAW